jgi:hypothetical protein
MWEEKVDRPEFVHRARKRREASMQDVTITFLERRSLWEGGMLEKRRSGEGERYFKGGKAHR